MVQVLSDRVGQAGSHRWIETESCNVASCRRHHALQAGKSDRVRVGNPRPSVGRTRLFAGEYSECQLDQQVRDGSERLH